MNPMFFGQSESPLYGLYHSPQSSSRNEGVVLCYPFGQEYMRAHRAFRQLALLLTKKGYHVLRFDFRGTGDSSGSMDDVEAEHWLRDINDAVTELRETASVDRVNVVGLRLGALFAAHACSRRTDIERLVVWDPVLSGELYEKELLEEIASDVPTEYDVSHGNEMAGDGTLHFNGFSMSARFRESIKGLSLMGSIPSSVPKLLHVVSVETDQVSQLREAWRGHPGYRYQYAPAPHDWNEVDNFGGILLPQAVIQAIVNWLEAQQRP
jgi:pimeloyl-ACP methyl ester carboxylesterase